MVPLQLGGQRGGSSMARTLVTGCNGQLGRAVRALADARGLLDNFDFCDIDEFDFSNLAQYDRYDWSLYDTLINCGAYTAVDRAETPEGRIACWRANATGPALLARTCSEHGITLVHVSSDYVFDGSRKDHGEDEDLSPLSVYGQSKAAGDLAVGGCSRHYVVRSSWVIGEGKNFVLTMRRLSRRCADATDPLTQVTVVNDQFGRLTFTNQMAEGIFALIDSGAPYGTYNLTGSGRVVSWAEIAREVFAFTCGNDSSIRPVSTAEYYAAVSGSVAPRPRHSDLDLSKICAIGFVPRNWEDELRDYLSNLEED